MAAAPGLGLGGSTKGGRNVGLLRRGVGGPQFFTILRNYVIFAMFRNFSAIAFCLSPLACLLNSMVHQVRLSSGQLTANAKSQKKLFGGTWDCAVCVGWFWIASVLVLVVGSPGDLK